MRIERVLAVAFGPFRGDAIEFAPGMTIVSGPNEAGKSSWHAAVRSAICGVRRGRGRPSEADATFAALHRPWDQPEPWEVEARLTLDDGRRIEIRQDLAGRIASRAVDRDLGHDLSAEIIHDGAPDASRWLGLTRDGFVKTICIDQADILAVTGAATALQDQLQRAAATHGTDATAAEALARLAAFRADAVGTDRAATKPVRVARSARDAAHLAVGEARRAHSAYLELVERAEAARDATHQARAELRLVEAAVARREASGLERQLARACELAARYPEEPPGLPARDELADEVAAAINGWADRPVLRPLEGDTAEQLRIALAQLPDEPDGDLAAAHEVTSAHGAWMGACQAEGLNGEPPAALPASETGGLSEPDLLRLAADIAATEPPPDPEGERRLAAAREKLADLASPPVVALVGAAGALLLGAVVAATVGAPVVSVVVVLVAGSAGLWAYTRQRALTRAAMELVAAEQTLEPHRRAVETARARREEAIDQVRTAGLGSDAAALVSLAATVAAHGRSRQERDAWDTRFAAAHARVESTARTLKEELADRGIAIGDDLDAAFAAYETACRDRSAQHTEAAKTDSLRRALRAREEAEEAARVTAQRVADAELALRNVAARVGVEPNTDMDNLVGELQRTQAARAEAASASERALREWQELQGLLGAGSLVDLESRVTTRARRASELVAGFDGESIAAAPIESDSDAQIVRLRHAAEANATRSDQLEGEVSSTSPRLRSVPEAEEALDRAEADVTRLERLGATVDRTIELLEAAQQRVHRDLAPVLADAIRPQLAAVTAGRYVDVAVDPATLEVRVKESPELGGRWRAADYLSRGTREQVYLLLRAAMAQHLVTTNEVAPLLLDEVTAQSDDGRAAAILATLHELSSDRQVVLFSHDPTVVAWARENLSERDRLIELAVVGTMTPRPS